RSCPLVSVYSLCIFSNSFSRLVFLLFLSNNPATTKIYTLSLHDALPIFAEKLYIYNWTEYIPNSLLQQFTKETGIEVVYSTFERSEEHTSELQSRFDLVCRLLLEKKKK